MDQYLKNWIFKATEDLRAAEHELRLADEEVVTSSTQKGTPMNATNALESILHNFRTVATSPREMGTYFEELCLLYFKNEP